MEYKFDYYPESKFGGFTNVDIAIVFYLRVNSLINSSSIVLDVGCGRGAYGEDPVITRRNLRILKGKCKKVVGIDVNDCGAVNPFIDEFRLIKKNERWPLEDGSVDVCVCDHVLEHMKNPELLFSECQRVIRPGGYLCLRTPNARGYVALFSKLIPNRFHNTVLNKIKERNNEKDVFPTFYKCNTINKIELMLNRHNFDYCVSGYEAEPSYLSFSRFFYFLGVFHQRFAFNNFKLAILAFAKKRS